MMNQNQIIPRKGDVIISPKTNRPIRVGSTAWRGLAREGLVPNYYTDPKVLCNAQSEEEVETKINELNQTLPYTHQAVRGRGHYKNQIVMSIQESTLPAGHVRQPVSTEPNPLFDLDPVFGLYVPIKKKFKPS